MKNGINANYFWRKSGRDRIAIIFLDAIWIDLLPYFFFKKKERGENTNDTSIVHSLPDRTFKLSNPRNLSIDDFLRCAETWKAGSWGPEIGSGSFGWGAQAKEKRGGIKVSKEVGEQGLELEKLENWKNNKKTDTYYVRVSSWNWTEWDLTERHTYPDKPFHNFKATKSVDPRIICSSGTWHDRF